MTSDLLPVAGALLLWMVGLVFAADECGRHPRWAWVADVCMALCIGGFVLLLLILLVLP